MAESDTKVCMEVYIKESLNSVLANTDHDLIDFNLSLSYEERLLNHQRSLDTINELLKARVQIYGESESSTQTPS